MVHVLWLLGAAQGGKKGPVVLDQCMIFVASSYPDWQQNVLDRMREGFIDPSKKLEKKEVMPCTYDFT